MPTKRATETKKRHCFNKENSNPTNWKTIVKQDKGTADHLVPPGARGALSPSLSLVNKLDLVPHRYLYYALSLLFILSSGHFRHTLGYVYVFSSNYCDQIALLFEKILLFY